MKYRFCLKDITDKEKEAFGQMIHHLALMGYRAVRHYTEDTCCIEEEPYLGYQRERYSREEPEEAVLHLRKEENMAPPAWRDAVSGCNV